MPAIDKEGKVALKHVELGLESKVMLESVPVWLASGWQLVDDKEVKAPEVVAEPAKANSKEK